MRVIFLPHEQELTHLFFLHTVYHIVQKVFMCLFFAVYPLLLQLHKHSHTHEDSRLPLPQIIFPKISHTNHHEIVR